MCANGLDCRCGFRGWCTKSISKIASWARVASSLDVGYVAACHKCRFRGEREGQAGCGMVNGEKEAGAMQVFSAKLQFPSVLGEVGRTHLALKVSKLHSVGWGHPR